MNPLLQQKIDNLDTAQEYECWYLVKHSTDFCNLCYLVEALEEFQTKTGVYKNVESAVNDKINLINSSKGLTLSPNYRALRVAAFFGLIKMNSTSYADAEITEVFYEIKNKCSGLFENKDEYSDVITRQIEKLYVSSTLDDGHTGVRKEYKIFPVMFLYKVLLELGKITGSYSISSVEYSYLVATTKLYTDYLDTMILIKLLRDEPSVESTLRSFDRKFDNRMNKAIELLQTLIVTGNTISIKSEYLEYVAKKVYNFENGNYDFSSAEYIEFLCSKDEIATDNVTSSEIESNEETTTLPNVKGGNNKIYYGTPGCGKSYLVDSLCKKDNSIIYRTVFHPEYSNTDFIGQIIPKIDENDSSKITYEFEEGIFTKALVFAFENPDKKVVLIIEEINRGNASAIFGEIFQLLDRNENGESTYTIKNKHLAESLKKDFDYNISLPSNLFLIGTMNTSDQNVYTLDTAFKRRWDMVKIRNTFNVLDDQTKLTDESLKYLRELSSLYIPGSNYTWRQFVEAVNEKINKKSTTYSISSEDKEIGIYFVSKKYLCVSPLDNNIDKLKMFGEKVLMYIWNDIAKTSPNKWFDYDTLDILLNCFEKNENNESLSVFNNELFPKIISDAVESSEGEN